MDEPKVAAVTINWKRADDTIECIRSMLTERFISEVIMVDNGSMDGSVEKISESCPEATIIEAGSNLGYVKGLNLGIKRAMQRKPTHLLIINNDAVVRPGFMEAMLQAMSDHPQAGIVGPKIFYYGTNRLWFAGGDLNRYLGYTKHPYMDEEDIGQTRERRVDYINGCAMLVKSEVLESIGLFDPEFGMYAEDLDFCLRAEEKGFESWYTPAAVVLHKVSSSAGISGSNAMTPMRSYYYARNMFIVVKKRLRGMERWSSLMGQFLISLPYYTLLIINHGVKGSLRSYLKGMLDGIRWTVGEGAGAKAVILA